LLVILAPFSWVQEMEIDQIQICKSVTLKTLISNLPFFLVEREFSSIHS
jgi:hypothetical protein